MDPGGDAIQPVNGFETTILLFDRIEMGVDCSMILRDDNLRELKTFEEKIARIRAIEDFLVKKYGIVNREEAFQDRTFSGDEFPSFDFKPYGIIGINMYDGFWEIETGWRYSQYFDKDGGPSGLQDTFFDIARDFGCDEAYICSEFCAWNGGDLEDHNFDEWLDEMRSRFGEIRELTSDTKYNWDTRVFPEVVHDSFTACKEKMAELSRKVEAKGYIANGILCIGRNYITVSKDDKVYLMHDQTLELLIPDPIDYWMDLNCSSFEIVSKGINMLFSSHGRKIFETDQGHYQWEWARFEEWNDYHPIRVFNGKSGQEVFVVHETGPSGNSSDICLFHCYYDTKHNLLFPRERY